MEIKKEPIPVLSQIRDQIDSV